MKQSWPITSRALSLWFFLMLFALALLQSTVMPHIQILGVHIYFNRVL